MKRMFTTGLLLVALAVLMASPAAAQYPPADGDTTVELSTSSPVVGGEVTVASSGWQASSTVEIWLYSTPRDLGTATANTSGAFSTEVAIPADVEAGQHTLRLVGTGADGESRTVETTVTVVSAAGAAGDANESGTLAQDELASTGLDFTLGTVGLVTLALVGGTIFVAGRKRAKVGA